MKIICFSNAIIGKLLAAVVVITMIAMTCYFQILYFSLIL